MRTLIVVESVWGNTQQIGAAVAARLATTGDVDLVAAADAPGEVDADLLVVGAPTHAFGLPSAKTRAGAVQQQGAPAQPDRGLREWIAALPRPTRSIAVATFDTKVDKPRLPGSAAKKAMKRLIALGYVPVERPETFRVHGYTGPLVDGETDRAGAWAEQLVRAVAT
ncbi:hypothetical protein GS433_04270 [Rhodococcus hoagii]|uniref:flavodoxin family protein n=1 Tax=Rhodococcus hoagii TaxID=43767 RepID=UPI0007CD668D|nr:hypothetical protein [Prescottella equi]MBM4533608.1 hypothetical protein [Prescottella equi]NKR84319.1 hypothetical protein [Prescottella equi]ORJ96524.1 hypothetical protein A6F56_16070 [Prescottella equi]ORL06971.1 hypothetical protein A6I84_15215 [Prescottella equi]ORL76125.1 hypothetical protein A5N75_12250 [Prescottella equi]